MAEGFVVLAMVATVFALVCALLLLRLYLTQTYAATGGERC